MIEDRLHKKRLLATVDRVKSLKAEVETARTEQERKATERLLERAEALRRGLAGRRWGKYKVPEERIDVQLGEDLRPSLRELKVRSPDVAKWAVLTIWVLRSRGTCSRIAS
jgi:nucleolar protein 53